MWHRTQEGIPKLADYTISELKMENKNGAAQKVEGDFCAEKLSPGASAAAVELLRPGCGKRGEGKAWTVD